jgi:ABC-type branched-subunit amino acid transport system substrate-binding protein
MRRLCAVALLIGAVLMAGCTSPTTKGTTTGTGSDASTTGITSTTVKIALITVDLSLLSKQHLAPDLGDPVKAAHAVVDEINAKGGVAGRKIVLTTHTIANGPLATADALQAACTEATEQDQAFAVIIAAAVPVNVAQCTAVTHDQLTLGMDSWQQSLYDSAHGRLFSVASQLSVSIERQYAALPAIFQSKHLLDGKTVGILNQDQPSDRTAAAAALKSALDKAHIPLAAEATAPYEAGNTSCSQTDVAIQKMKAAKVDFVFLVAQNLCAASLVEAAQKAGYRPQWATLGNNVTDTVANFFAPAKENYDGAWGVSGSPPASSPEAKTCNDIVAKGAGLVYAPGSDPYGFAAATCVQIQTVADAIAAAKSPLDQGTVIAALQAMHSVPLVVNPAGTLDASKHDAGNYVWLARYSAATGKFTLVDPSSPLRVP